MQCIQVVDVYSNSLDKRANCCCFFIHYLLKLPSQNNIRRTCYPFQHTFATHIAFVYRGIALIAFINWKKYLLFHLVFGKCNCWYQTVPITCWIELNSMNRHLVLFLNPFLQQLTNNLHLTWMREKGNNNNNKTSIACILNIFCDVLSIHKCSIVIATNVLFPWQQKTTKIYRALLISMYSIMLNIILNANIAKSGQKNFYQSDNDNSNNNIIIVICHYTVLLFVAAVIYTAGNYQKDLL